MTEYKCPNDFCPTLNRKRERFSFDEPVVCPMCKTQLKKWENGQFYTKAELVEIIVDNTPQTEGYRCPGCGVAEGQVHRGKVDMDDISTCTMETEEE